MDKLQLQEKAEKVKKELDELQKEYDTLSQSLKKSSFFPTVENERDLEIVEKELNQKKLIFKEFKERLRNRND